MTGLLCSDAFRHCFPQHLKPFAWEVRSATLRNIASLVSDTAVVVNDGVHIANRYAARLGGDDTAIQNIGFQGKILRFLLRDS